MIPIANSDVRLMTVIDRTPYPQTKKTNNISCLHDSFHKSVTKNLNWNPYLTICCRVIFLEVTEIKLEPSLKRSHSRIKFQFSDEHLRPFHTEITSSPLPIPPARPWRSQRSRNRSHYPSSVQWCDTHTLNCWDGREGVNRLIYLKSTSNSSSLTSSLGLFFDKQQ